MNSDLLQAPQIQEKSNGGYISTKITMMKHANEED
jgi:hypothetical protein